MLQKVEPRGETAKDLHTPRSCQPREKPAPFLWGEEPQLLTEHGEPVPWVHRTQRPGYP